jgi:hypothetical protein
MKNDTETTGSLQAGPGETSLRLHLAETLYADAVILAYSVGHDIGELTDVVVGLAGRGVMVVPYVGNAPQFATATATGSLGNSTSTKQDGTVLVQRRFGGRQVSLDRGELTTEEYIEALAAAVKNESLGQCSRGDCDRPAIEAKPGYTGPLYCSPVHAFTDRAHRVGA